MKRLNPYSGFIEMNMIAIVGLCIVAAAISVVLRQYKPEYALLVSLGTGIAILLMVVGAFQPLLDQLEKVVAMTQMPEEYLQILFKSLGVCMITQIASDVCKDAGESAISTKVETAGRIAVLLISLPLFEKVLSIAQSLVAG